MSKLFCWFKHPGSNRKKYLVQLRGKFGLYEKIVNELCDGGKFRKAKPKRDESVNEMSERRADNLYRFRFPRVFQDHIKYLDSYFQYKIFTVMSQSWIVQHLIISTIYQVSDFNFSGLSSPKCNPEQIFFLFSLIYASNWA